jgi:hypothetical protein
MDCHKGVQKCRAGGIFKWEKAKGWTNPCNHLLTCFFNDRINTMANAFWDEYDKTVGGNVASYLPLGGSEGYAKRDDATFAWINIILRRNELISAVEDSVLRRELKHSEQVSKKYLKKVIFKLAQAQIMKESRAVNSTLVSEYEIPKKWWMYGSTKQVYLGV